MIGISTFQRKTFRVQAVQVTVQNMKTIGEWCDGEFKAPEAPGRRAYVAVPGRGDHIIRAYVGDWITRLTDKNAFHVYSNKQFMLSFDSVLSEDEKRAKIQGLLEELFSIDTDRSDRMHKELTAEFTKHFMHVLD